MKKETTHIRVKGETRKRLLKLIRSLTVQSERGTIIDIRDSLENPNPAAQAVSFDAAINFLIDLRDKHRVRADKSAAKRKAAKRAKDTSVNRTWKEKP